MICFFSNLLVSYLCTVALWPYGHINENADCLAKGRLWFLSPPQNKQQKPVLDQLFPSFLPSFQFPLWARHLNWGIATFTSSVDDITMSTWGCFFKTLYFKRNFFGKKRFTPKNTKIDVPIFTPGGRRILGGMLSPPPQVTLDVSPI